MQFLKAGKRLLSWSDISLLMAVNADLARPLAPKRHPQRLFPDVSNVQKCNLKAKVSKLIEDHKWHIPDGIRRQIPDVINRIEDTEIGGVTDEIIWAPALKGAFTLKVPYEFIRKKGAPRLLHRLVWLKNRIPRHAFVCWMALKKGLKTLHKLRAWGVVDDDTCMHCWGTAETQGHLLSDWRIAKQI